MAGLTTGSPIGNIITPEELFIEGSPYIFVQDSKAPPLNNPDANGYYWNMSGTSTYPVYQLGCIQDVKMTEDVTLAMIRCDTVGDKDAIQRRNYIDIEFQLNSVFPLNMARLSSNFSPSLTMTGREYSGISRINNRQWWMVYMPKVYDEVNNSWIMAHFHRVKFVGNFSWAFGIDGWKITGLKARALIDETKPSNQLFGTLARFDSTGVLP